MAAINQVSGKSETPESLDRTGLVGRKMDDLEGVINYDDIEKIGNVEVWRYRNSVIIPVCETCWIIADTPIAAAECCTEREEGE